MVRFLVLHLYALLLHAHRKFILPRHSTSFKCLALASTLVLSFPNPALEYQVQRLNPLPMLFQCWSQHFVLIARPGCTLSIRQCRLVAEKKNSFRDDKI